MRRLLFCLLLAACPGLFTAQGNDFPCDFSEPPGVRDEACSSGDVCGVDNQCRRFRYEGPQFEGRPTFPVFSDGGRVLHPMTITGPVEFITRTPRDTITLPSGPIARESVAFVKTPTALYSVDGPFVDVSSLTTELTDLVVIGRLDRAFTVIGRGQRGNLAVQDGPGPARPVMPLVSPSRLRAFEVDGQSVVVAVGQETGQVTTDNNTAAFTRWPATSVFDVAPGPLVAPRQRAGITLLTRDGLAFRLRDGGIEPVGEPFTVEPGAVLSSDSSGSVYAVIRQQGPDLGILSTFEVSRTGQEFDVSQPWNDCTPCKPARAPFAMTPGQDGEGVFVDVLCPDGLLRVRGASGLAVRDSCESEPRTLPFDFAQLGRRTAPAFGDIAQQDVATPVGFLGGGRQGQVWAGTSLSEAKPLFLDRVPSDLERISIQTETGGEALALLALTNTGIFVRPEDPQLAARTNGFARVELPDLGDKRLAGLVHESLGWTVLSSGDLFYFKPALRTGMVPSRDGGTVGRFGPQLVDGRGEPVSRVLRGEAINDFDGELVSMVIAADDSLYFVPAPETAGAPGNLGTLSPQVTPEPSSLIRSIALERTPIGTDGVERVRGYVVTSRNVYEFKLGGAPLQWTTTPLKLSGGEPMEVWFDNPRGGLGRAGYRDGTIFTIPGGFQLTESLPATDAGVPAAVIDYENLAGWPVALTTTGLFVARYDATADGRLDSRFPDGGLNKPMRWREVTLPDGSRPWLKNRRVEGVLHVQGEPEADAGAVYRRLFRLFVYLPDQVIEVGTHERSNVSAIVQ